MRRLIISIVVLLSFSAAGSYAHGPDGGGHGTKTKITENQAREKATQSVGAIVKKGQLDASWSRIQPAEAEKKTTDGRVEWIVTFINPAEKDAAKKKLYVFLSLYGEYAGSNFKGE